MHLNRMTLEEALATMTVPLQENGSQRVREVFNPILLLKKNKMLYLQK